MTFKQILTAAREELRDTSGSNDNDFKLTSSMALRYCNEAEHEACRRSRLLIDADTAEICTIAITAGQSVYSLDERVVKIIAAELVGKSTPLFKTYRSDMPVGWKDHTGSISSWVNDYATGKICFYRKPVENGVVQLTVQRTPLNTITLTGTPEIPSRYHYALVDYLVAMARDNDDSELYDPVKAAKAMARFDAEFGVKRSAQSEAYEASQPYSEDE